MAIRTPPLYLQGGTHTAENDRLGITGMVTSEGCGPGTAELEVTQSGTPAMTVAVAVGHGWVNGTTSTTQGTYKTYNDAPVTLTITTANATLPRIDKVCLTIRDAAYAGASNDCILQVIAGTAAASPTAPATPASSLVLATVAVAAAATTIVNANITDTRTRAQMGLPLSTSAVGQLSGIPQASVTNLVSDLASKTDLAMTKNAQTGVSYSYALADQTKLLTMSNASANTVTVTKQATVTWAADTQLRVLNLGAGVTTLVADTGVTINNNTTLSQWGGGVLIRMSSDVWTFVPFASGVGAANFSDAATGTYSGYKYLTLTASGTITFNKAGFADILVIGGGGGGGTTFGAGGGAGGYLAVTDAYFDVGTKTVTIGAGGSGGLSTPYRSSNNGNASRCGDFYGVGGGGGGAQSTDIIRGLNGGSGGGGPALTATNTGGSGIAGQGFAGGAGAAGDVAGGGGGGASQVGFNGSAATGGAGGDGLASSITGASVTRGGGGGGGGNTLGAGGAGGGGAGAISTNNATAGGANTGGGGGGTYSTGAGGAGGSGIVIVRVAV